MRSPHAVRPQIVDRICNRLRGSKLRSEAASSAIPATTRTTRNAWERSGTRDRSRSNATSGPIIPRGYSADAKSIDDVRCGAQRPNGRSDLIDCLHKKPPSAASRGRWRPSSTLSAGPAAALRMLAWEPADRCDATRGNLQADRVDAAEATSFCAWLCAWSSSQSSSPRTSSSIWLSSPYCPPSHKRWRFRNSAVANRHALHSDYYSTMRKTATPLNESWMAGMVAVIAVRTVPALATCSDRSGRCARSTRAEISSADEKPCGTRVFDMCASSHRVCPNGCAPIRSDLAMTWRRRGRTILRPQKNFRSRPPASRAGRKIPLKRSESPH